MKIIIDPQTKLSPMMIQWYECKKKAAGAVLLFRLGDFYEAFYEDATLLSRELDLTLTRRQGIPMSGVPAHTCDTYVEKLVEKGYLVAIAEQMEDPKKTKGLVKREIVKIVSPGTLLNSTLLSEKANNFFACLTQVNSLFAISLLDLSTGELHVTECDKEKEILDELFRRKPSEILISEKSNKHLSAHLENMKRQFQFRLTIKEEWCFNHQSSYDWLTRHFGVHSLDGFGLKGMIAAINGAGALLSHVQDVLNLSLDHIKNIQIDHLSDYMAIDTTTERHLELTEPIRSTGTNYTLLHLLDQTETPMGARLLKSWVTHPLLSPTEIGKRQDAIEELIRKQLPSKGISKELQSIRDIERLITRISSGYTSPRDLTALRFSLENIPPLLELLNEFQSIALKEIQSLIPDVNPLIERIKSTLIDEPPIKVSEGGLIRLGFDQELDALRSLKKNSQVWLANYQSSLKETTGIKTLKIIYSKGFGYCIEVSRGQATRVPEIFQRKQTLVNAERFTTKELSEYEEKILTAEEKIQTLEEALYQTLRKEVATHTQMIKKIGRSIAKIDSLLSLSLVAHKYCYVRPVVTHSDQIDIQVGRHPVIESILFGDTFIPNDTLLDNRENRLLLLTGPNMAGKSTYIRQVALITIMAQMGSFVPAKSAKIGIVDKVFSRIGASDDLSAGQSTFMVEMTETANIIHNATPRSLVILDEIGRGTSTYDGVSIAWAVAEALLQLKKEGVKTLFATHYWELTELKKQTSGVKNFTVAVKESSENIIFLRKIIEGSTDKSYGIHVARIAGLPHFVIKRAEEILASLEQKAMGGKAPTQPRVKEEQLTFYPISPTKDGSILDEIKNLDLNHLTPMAVMEKVLSWQKKLSS